MCDLTLNPMTSQSEQFFGSVKNVIVSKFSIFGQLDTNFSPVSVKIFFISLISILCDNLSKTTTKTPGK